MMNKQTNFKKIQFMFFKKLATIIFSHFSFLLKFMHLLATICGEHKHNSDTNNLTKIIIKPILYFQI